MSGPPASGGPVGGVRMGGPGQPAGGRPGGFAGGGGPPVGAAPRPPSGPRRRSPLPFLIGVCAVLAVAVVVLGVIAIVRSGGDDATPRASGSSTPTASASESPSVSPTPSDAGVHGDKIVDEATGWQFTMAGDPWTTVARPRVTELVNPVGQSVDLGGSGYASIQLGQLADSFDYSGPDDLKSTKNAVTKAMLSRYYGTGAKPDTSGEHIDEKLTQYGHKAWLWAYDVTYTSGGKSASEYVVMAVLDSDGGKAAIFWGSVPDGHSDLKKDMKDAASTLEPSS